MPSNILTYILFAGGIIILGLVVTVRVQSGTITGLRGEMILLGNNNISLRNGIETQNDRLLAYSAKVAQSLEASQEALRASQADAEKREATIAELLARPLQDDLLGGCVVSDRTILEFYQ